MKGGARGKTTWLCSIELHISSNANTSIFEEGELEHMTSIDYDPKNEKTIEFFKIVQNKLFWAISSQTAAELVHN